MATFRLIRTLVVLLVAANLLTATASANNYQVQAVIPYPPPTQAAVISPGIDGTTVQAALQTISGTCQIQNPTNVVSIWRSGSSIGSSPCVAGVFSLQIMLVPGQNDLIARTANPNIIYGPDSAQISVTLVLPPNPPPPPTGGGPEPKSPAEQVIVTNAAANSGLTITPTQAFGVLGASYQVTVSVAVGGGEHPYDIFLNWGDGSTDTHHVDTAGTYTFTHTYQAAGSYKVHGLVHDMLGATSEFDYAVVSALKSTVVGSGSGHGHWSGNVIVVRHSWWQSPMTYAKATGVIAVLAGAYWLGVHHTVAQAVQAAKPGGRAPTRGRTSAKPKPKAKAKKPNARRKR